MPPSLKKPSHDWNPRISVFTLWSASHIFPSLEKKKKKKLLRKLDLSPTPQGNTWWTRSRVETRGRQSKGGWPPQVGRQAGRHVRVTTFSSSALQRETTHGTDNSHTTDDNNGLCCHQKEGKPRTNFTVVFTTRSLQSCSGHVTVTPPTEQNHEGNQPPSESPITAYP